MIELVRWWPETIQVVGQRLIRMKHKVSEDLEIHVERATSNSNSNILNGALLEKHFSLAIIETHHDDWARQMMARDHSSSQHFSMHRVRFPRSSFHFFFFFAEWIVKFFLCFSLFWIFKHVFCPKPFYRWFLVDMAQVVSFRVFCILPFEFKFFFWSLKNCLNNLKSRLAKTIRVFVSKISLRNSNQSNVFYSKAGEKSELKK